MDYSKFNLFLIALIWHMAIAQCLNNIGYEIKSLYGQPAYHSVELSWEVEDKYADNRINGEQQPEEEEEHKTESRSFIINYCEMQGFDLQRCNAKIMTDHGDDVEYEKGTAKIYKMTIKNLRMATKYSFNVRPKRTGDFEKTARNSLKEADPAGQSQTIVLPTKGFTVQATTCLPNESEIEIQTGPFFSGKIASENGECEIQGDPKDDSEIYVMRIDHEKCGSVVSNDDLTVETYITVQENSGILTHSTRRFLVVCTFQPDTLTVRAKLALPSKNGGVAAVAEEDDLQAWPTAERSSRKRQFKMVDKSALILKESSDHSVENAIGDVENLTEKILSNEKEAPSTHVHQLQAQSGEKKAASFKNPRFSRYATEQENSTPFQIDAIAGVTIGVALIVLIAFIVFYALRREEQNGLERMRQNTTALYN